MLTINCFPEVCELEIRLENDPVEESELCCVADFRICPGNIALGEDDCEILITKARIKVEIEGLQPVPKSRFGEPVKQNAAPLTRRMTETSSASGNLQAQAEASLGAERGKAAIYAKVSHERSSALETSKEMIESTNHLFVRALPSLQWEVSEPANEPLSATYLNGDTLVKIVRANKANRSSISVSVSTHQRHITIRPEKPNHRVLGIFEQKDQTKKRLMDIFIAKSLSQSLSWEKYRGELKLSEHSRELENDA